MNYKLLLALGISGLFGGSVTPKSPRNMYRWLNEMRTAQIDLLKINWGQPGFCTEWDRDFSRTSQLCGKRGKLMHRKYPD